MRKRSFFVVKCTADYVGGRRVPLTLSLWSPPEDEPITLSFLGNHSYKAFSCGGLLCFTKLSYDDIFLYNPTTQESKLLPTSDVERPPRAVSFPIGFGYDIKSKDYKIIRFPVKTYSGTYEEGHLYSISTDHIELYSLKDDRWRKVSNAVEHIALLNLRSTYVNGSLYWVANESTSTSSKFVVTFDMAEETFGSIPLPTTCMPPSLTGYDLVDCKGSLGIILYPKKGKCKSFQLWVLVDGLTSWTKVFHVSLPGVESALGFSGNGNLLFLESKKQSLLVYDFENRKLSQPQLIDLAATSGMKFDILAFPKWIQFIPYVQSTISLSDGIPSEDECISSISYVESTIPLSDSIIYEDEDEDEFDDEEEEEFVDEEEEFLKEELQRTIWG